MGAAYCFRNTAATRARLETRRCASLLLANTPIACSNTACFHIDLSVYPKRNDIFGSYIKSS